MSFHRRLFLFLVTAATLTGCTGGKLSMKTGERIVFFGDSITEQGVKPNGYITLFREELKTRYPDFAIEVIGAGVSGNKVPDLQNRLAKDVIEKKPNAVVIYIGINDVWHWKLNNLKGTTEQQYESGLREIIARIEYSGAEVILCTPSVIGEVPDSTYRQNQMLNQYAAISRKITKDRGVRLCDLHKAFDIYLLANNPDKKEKGILTTDGVHLNDEGNKFVAKELLRFF
jgi:lysophospholipase L1-like esterase